MKNSRYPGIYSFSESQSHIFFGRENDIESLKTLVETESQVLLYSKSGIGKTSLLNAGVLPKLSQNYKIIELRFTAYNTKNYVSPVKRVLQQLHNNFPQLSKANNTLLDLLTDDELDKQTLWYNFKKLQLIPELSEFTYLLVFDQFEELFSYPDTEIEQFKNELYELTRVSLPNKYNKFMAEKRREFPDKITRKTAAGLQKSISVKTLFSIRSDKLSLLNMLTDKLNDIQKTFYELLPLTNQQAQDAITLPAKAQGEFDSNAFTYTPEALAKIMKFLTANHSQNVESTQLQIVCRRIEEQDDLDNIIEESEVPDFKNIFFDFYNSAILKTQENKHKAARRLVEDELIRNKQRISLDEIICKDYVDKDDLKILTDAYLLRAEQNSTGGISYELSHDTLIEPILISRKKRKEEEEEERAKAEQIKALKIANEKAEKERIEHEKEKKKQRQINIIISIAAVISIGFGIFGFAMWQNSKRALIKVELTLIEAERQKEIAENKGKEITDMTIESTRKDAFTNMMKGKHKIALDKYISLRDIFGDSSTLTKERIIQCKKLIVRQKAYDSLIVLIDISMKKEGYKRTVDLYEEALETGMDGKKLVSKLKDLSETINKLKENYNDEAEAAPANRPDLKNKAKVNEQKMAALIKKIKELIKTVER